jgi:UDP-N-acetylglucosamine:LPS N-acetylglucosamine transferase
MTDMADLPPHFWIEPGVRQHLVCGTSHAVAQAQAAGHAAEQISQVSGMILRPEFHAARCPDRAEGQRALGLDPARPIGVVMFGGEGSRQMLGIARRLRDVQLILLCGRNDALAKRLRAQPTQAPHAVLGFTSEVERYMALGDFFIGKPGPGSLSEAVQMGLPAIIFDNAWTMPQERYNTQWLREQGLGLVLRSPRQLRQGVVEMLQRLPELRARVQAINNRAVFEVVEILARLLAQAEGNVTTMTWCGPRSGHPAQ